MALFGWALKNWRLVAIGAAVLAALAAAGWLYERGRAAEQAKQNAASLKAYEQRTRIDETLDAKSPRELCLAAGGGGGCNRLSDQP